MKSETAPTTEAHCLAHNYTYEVKFDSRPPLDRVVSSIRVEDPYDAGRFESVMLRYEALPPLRVAPSHVVFLVSEKTMRDASVLLLVTDVRKTSGIGIDVIVPDACPLRAEHAEASESDSALVHVQLRWKPGVPLKEGTWNLIIQDRDSTEDAITVPVRVVREIEP